MKKLMMIAVMAVAGLAASAQTYYGSQKGGFAVTFNANPILNYAGNLFNGTQNNKLEDFNGLKNGLFSGTTITGKYQLTDNVAIDLGFGFDNNYDTEFEYKSDDFEKEVSYSKDANTAFMIKGGVEYNLRPGQRIQPKVSADLVYVHRNSYDYTEITSGSNDGHYAYHGAPVNSVGIMASVGVEYFIIKQISVGATVDFGAAKSWAGHSYDIKDNSGSKDGSRIDNTSTRLKTGNFGGNLSLNFYF